MRYITYKLKWVADYGYSPTELVAAEGSELTPSSYIQGSQENLTILGYLIGELDLTKISEYQPTEMNEEEALAFANSIIPDSFFKEDGTISPQPLEYI